MATFRIDTPDGRSFEITGDRMPNEQEISEILGASFADSEPQAQENTYEDINSSLRKIGGAIEAANSGYQFGLGKKAGGLINAIGAAPVDAILSDKSLADAFSDRYNEIVQGAKGMRQEFSKENPISDTMIELAGAIKGAPGKITEAAIKKAGDLTSAYGKLAQYLAKVGAVGTSTGATVTARDAINADNTLDYLTSEDAAESLAKNSLYGAAIPVGVSAGKAVASKVVPKVLGMTTGAGENAIVKAFEAGKRNSKAFVDNMRQKVGYDEAVKKAKDSLDKIKQARSRSYADDMERIKQDKSTLDINPVIRQVKRIISSEADGAEYLVDDDTARVLNKTKDILNKFYKDKERHNVSGFDALKKSISEINTKPDTNAERIKGIIADSVKGEILKQSPKYKQVMDNYSKDSDIIDQLKKTFSIDDRANLETTLRKIQSVTRNNANTSFDYRKKLLDILDKNGEISNAIAGQSLSSYLPRGVTANIGALFSGVNPSTIAFSPRVVGEASYGAGRLARSLDKLKGKTPKNLYNLVSSDENSKK